MAEPTLLQQAREHFDQSLKWTGKRAWGLQRVAINCMLKHLEQREAAASGSTELSFEPSAVIERLKARDAVLREAAASGPAQVPSEPACTCEQYPPTCALHGEPRYRVPSPPPTVTVHDLVLMPGESRDLPDGRHLHNHGQTALFINLRTNTVRMAPPTTVADIDLDELQRLCDAATPGPWRVAYGAHGELADAFTDNARDADFVMRARDALPKLIARVRKLQPIADVVDRAPRCPQCHKPWLGSTRYSHQARRCNDDAFADGCNHTWNVDEHGNEVRHG